MNLSEQFAFASIYSNFHNQIHTLKDVSEVIRLVKDNKNAISNESKKLLLQIPLNTLEKHVELKKSVSIWSTENGSYFAGNCAKEPYHSQFKSENFDLSVLTDYLQAIIDDEVMLMSDFCLRNPEVTIRDDVKLKDFNNFKECGLIYKKIIDKAFEL